MENLKPQGKKLDILVVILLNIVGIVFTYITRDLFINKFLIAGLIVQTPVIVYLSLRSKKHWKKILLATLVFDMLFESFDFIAEYTRAWVVTSLVFPVKIFGVLPIDNVLGHISIVMYTIVFYEHFLNSDSKPVISPRIKNAFVVSASGLLLTASIFFYNPQLFYSIQYPFLVLGTLSVIPTILISYAKPNLFKKLSVAGVYFFFYYLTIELFAYTHRYWIYPGNNNIEWVTFLGRSFPFEEFFFWIIFYGPTIIAYYELWADDLE